MVNEKKFFSTTELAKLMGISRIAVYKKIKAGEIKAFRSGRNFVIEKKDLGGFLDQTVSTREKNLIRQAVRKTVREYGETLRLLGAS